MPLRASSAIGIGLLPLRPLLGRHPLRRRTLPLGPRLSHPLGAAALLEPRPHLPLGPGLGHGHALRPLPLDLAFLPDLLRAVLRMVLAHHLGLLAALLAEAPLACDLLAVVL